LIAVVVGRKQEAARTYSNVYLYLILKASVKFKVGKCCTTNTAAVIGVL
jgi:hypothetical protein